MGDRHRASDSLPEESADGAALGHERYTRPFSIWHRVGMSAVGLSSTEQIFSRRQET